MQKKGKQVAFSTKWGLGENVALRLIECLTSNIIFMDNYFSTRHLLTHLGVSNIRGTVVLTKNRVRKSTIIGEKQLQTKEHDLLE